jgi:hypothetical protein
MTSNRASIPRPLAVGLLRHVPDGSLEMLKLLALGLMTLDHINTYLWQSQVPWAYNVGRMAMPIFGVVFALNLARPEALEPTVYLRLARRLFGFGVLASVPYMAFNGPRPLNILFTFLVASLVCFSLQRGGPWMAAGLALFIVGGALVEYGWPGIAFVVAAWSCFRAPGAWRMVILALVWASLYVINRNQWALLAAPICFACMQLDVNLPRWRWLFYVYYPAHLAALWLLGRFVFD